MARRWYVRTNGRKQQLNTWLQARFNQLFAGSSSDSTWTQLKKPGWMDNSLLTTYCWSIKSSRYVPLNRNLSATIWTVQFTMHKCRTSQLLRAWGKSSWLHPSMWWPRTRSYVWETSAPAWSKLPTRCHWLVVSSNIIGLPCTISLPFRSNGLGVATRSAAGKSLRSQRTLSKYF